MNPAPMRLAILAAALCFLPQTALGLTGQEILRLKAAGLSDATLSVLEQEKTVETAALSVQEVLDMKAAGLSEETIRLLAREKSFLKGSREILYGRETRPLRLSTAGDLVYLKEAGLSDALIQAVILSASEKASDEDREKAWKMLEGMGILIDRRQPLH